MASCLVVDDSRVVRAVARRILEELKLDVTEAENGQVALQRCEDQMPDAVLLDWNMPVMDGIDFLKRLRSGGYEKQPIVVFCSTARELEQIQTAIEAGADEYIMKPFDQEIVQSKLQEAGVI
jgi:two-component system chemotaxis response regulator CheY